VRHFDPILLKGREWPLPEIEVTPELIKEVPHQSDNRSLAKITRRVAELYKNHENENSKTEVLLAGNFPSLLLSYFALPDNWTELMGLVLLSGFCPCALAGLSLSTLLERNIPERQQEWYCGRYAEKWFSSEQHYLFEHPTAEWILGKVSRDPGPWLLRLDGFTLHKNTINFEIYRQRLQQPHRDINTLPKKWTEYKDANGWQVPKGENALLLPPSEFVRFAEKIKFNIPWLGFAKAHFPHLLPEESTGRPTSATDTAISADTYRALKAERDEVEKCLENTKSELENLRSEKGAIESERNSPWPWGDHETKFLRKLTDAAHEWWSTYDPENMSTTPKNKEVSK